MKTLTPEQRKLALKGIENMMETFARAYRQREKGFTKEAIIISADIISAGNNVPLKLRPTIHKLIESACAAVDERVPLEHAKLLLRTDLIAFYTEAQKGS
jgi:hypothetical protein